MLWDKSEIFKILPFYDSYIERPKIKKLNNVQLLKELPFYHDLNIVKNKTEFSAYGRSYKIEIVNKKDVVVQLKSSEIALKELFKDLLLELKGFKYKITLCVLLSKVKNSGLIEYSTVYFNSLTKTVIGDDYVLNQCFNEIFRLENLDFTWKWMDCSGYFKSVFKFKQLFTIIWKYLYCKLPKELQHSKKDLINIQNNDNKCFFFWCHVRHLWRMSRKDKEIGEILNYSGINFPVSKKGLL